MYVAIAGNAILNREQYRKKNLKEYWINGSIDSTKKFELWMDRYHFRQLKKPENFEDFFTYSLRRLLYQTLLRNFNSKFWVKIIQKQGCMKMYTILYSHFTRFVLIYFILCWLPV